MPTRRGAGELRRVRAPETGRAGQHNAYPNRGVTPEGAGRHVNDDIGPQSRAVARIDPCDRHGQIGGLRARRSDDDRLDVEEQNRPDTGGRHERIDRESDALHASLHPGARLGPVTHHR